MKDRKDLTIMPKMEVSSNEPWEKHFKCEHGENDNPALSFRPMSGSKRAQPHKKVNECDH
jgi:hypothetical protein